MLLAEREVLVHEVRAAGEDRYESPDDGKEAVEHPRTMTAVGAEGNRAHPRAIRVACTGTQLVEGQGGLGYGEEHVQFRRGFSSGEGQLRRLRPRVNSASYRRCYREPMVECGESRLSARRGAGSLGGCGWSGRWPGR